VTSGQRLHLGDVLAQQRMIDNHSRRIDLLAAGDNMRLVQVHRGSHDSS
jgi:hypothetical protein